MMERESQSEQSVEVEVAQQNKTDEAKQTRGALVVSRSSGARYWLPFC
ncbi:hypothetical protein IAD21_00499 [Abditibacteriota bacterium]|nr:hypothetical protein IAD21_00499 [Abditibacteriota bacterium]